jgi:hypothetical protein
MATHWHEHLDVFEAGGVWTGKSQRTRSNGMGKWASGKHASAFLSHIVWSTRSGQYTHCCGCISTTRSTCVQERGTAIHKGTFTPTVQYVGVGTPPKFPTLGLITVVWCCSGCNGRWASNRRVILHPFLPCSRTQVGSTLIRA